MNTNILQWKLDEITGRAQTVFVKPALCFFLYTVGPLTLLTFCLWYAFIWRVKREEKQMKLTGQSKA